MARGRVYKEHGIGVCRRIFCTRDSCLVVVPSCKASASPRYREFVIYVVQYGVHVAIPLRPWFWYPLPAVICLCKVGTRMILTIAAPHYTDSIFQRAQDSVSDSKGFSNKTGDRAFSRPDVRKELLGGCETGFENQSTKVNF